MEEEQGFYDWIIWPIFIQNQIKNPHLLCTNPSPPIPYLPAPSLSNQVAYPSPLSTPTYS